MLLLLGILSHINSVKDAKAMLFLGDRFPPTGHFIIFTKMLSSFSSPASLYQIIHAHLARLLSMLPQSPSSSGTSCKSLAIISSLGLSPQPQRPCLRIQLHKSRTHSSSSLEGYSKIRGCRDDKTLKCLHTDTHPIAGSHDSLRVNHSLFILYQGQHYKKQNCLT